MKYQPRADVKAVEANLEKAKIYVRVAKKEFFPLKCRGVILCATHYIKRVTIRE